MDEKRKNRDFSKGPVWNQERDRWLVEIRYPDGSRLRKRFRRQRDAMRIWAAEQTKIESGTWHEQAPETITFAAALKQYREYSAVQNRSHRSYVEPALAVWDAAFDTTTLLARISPAQIDAVKMRRAQSVARGTVDKDLAVLKAFFDWCVPRNLAAANPVRRVKLFHDDNSRLRYLTREEYERLVKAGTIETSPYLEDKIVLAVHTGSSPRQSVWSPLGADRFRKPSLASTTNEERAPALVAVECDGDDDPSVASCSWQSHIALRLPSYRRPKGRRAGAGYQERVPPGTRAR